MTPQLGEVDLGDVHGSTTALTLGIRQSYCVNTLRQPWRQGEINWMSPGDTDMRLGLILRLRPANERRRYKLTPSLIGWAQT